VGSFVRPGFGRGEVVFARCARAGWPGVPQAEFGLV